MNIPSDDSMPDRPARTPRAAPKTPIPKTPPPQAHEENAPVEPESEAPLVPGALGPYKLIEELGRGGMGQVLRARDEALKRDVAVKRLRPDLRDEKQRLRFIEEAQITGQLEHPGIAPVYLLGNEGKGREFFSMKVVEGRTLDNIFNAVHANDRETRREFPLRRLLGIFERVCETVGFAHSRGIVHRDLKPANVMVGEHGEVWVLDWGLAKRIQDNKGRDKSSDKGLPVASIRQDLGAELTLDGHTVGTPKYMSPEQARGESIDERSDIFSLGGILYCLLTGQAPIQGQTLEAVVSNAALGKFTPVRRTRAGRDTAPALCAITEKCLLKNPSDRYKHTRELLRDLRAFQAGEEVAAYPDTALMKFRRSLKRHRTAATVGTVVAALLLIVVTVSAVLVAQHERTAATERQHALDAEQDEQKAKDLAISEGIKAKKADLEKQKSEALNAEKARKRLDAFVPYAEAMDLLLRGQVPEQAVAQLQKALNIDPEFTEAQFALGEALRRDGQPEPAAAAFLKADDLARKFTGHPHLQAIVAAGFAYDGAGCYEQAYDAFKRAEDAGAKDPLCVVGKIFRLCHDMQAKEALPFARAVVAQAPHLWETQFALGYVLSTIGGNGQDEPKACYAEAQAYLRKAIELDPNQAEIYVHLAATFYTSTAEEKLEQHRLMDQAVALEPRNGNRYISRGRYLLDVGNRAGAEADLKMAESLKANVALSAYLRAVLAYKAGDIKTAYESVRVQLLNTRKFPSVFANLAIIGYQAGKWEEIKPVLDHWVREMPQHFMIQFLSGFADHVECKQCLAHNDRAQAIACLERSAGKFQKAYAEAPYNPQIIQLYAPIAFESAKFSIVVELLERCEKLVGNLTQDQWKMRLQSLLQLKRMDELKAALERLEKDHPELKPNLEGYHKVLEKTLDVH